MSGAMSETAAQQALLTKLNDASWHKSFSPHSDVDWSDATTSSELLALHDQWSLLLGTRHQDALDDVGRARFAAYQHMNLMAFTAVFERCGMANFEQLYADDDDAAFQEYVTHLIKEEIYHHLLFQRAIAALRRHDPALLALPTWHMAGYIRLVMAVLRWLPQRLRHSMFFFFLRFAEEITLQANTVARQAVPRTSSLIPRVWQVHALDEARHVAFDDLMMRRAALPRLARALTLPLCVFASLLLNLNDIWAARQLGVRVGYHELPTLMRKTTSPFKRRVFGLLFRTPTPT